MNFRSAHILVLLLFHSLYPAFAVSPIPAPEPAASKCVPEHQALYEVYSQGARLLNPDGFFQVEPRIANCFVSRCLRYYYWAQYRLNCADRERFDQVRGDALPFCDRLFSPCVNKQQALAFLDDYIAGRANIPNRKPLSTAAGTCLRKVVIDLGFPHPRRSCTREFDVNKALNSNFLKCRTAS